MSNVPTTSREKDSGHLANWGPTVTAIKDIHAGMLETEICVRGTITRCGALLTAVMEIVYECERCKNEAFVPAKDNVVTSKGPSCEKCRWKKSNCKLQRALTADYQKVVIQESDSTSGHFLTLVLTGELCLQHGMGRSVCATGFLRAMKPTFHSFGGANKGDSVLRCMHLEVASLSEFGLQELCPIPDACYRLNNANQYMSMASIVHSLSTVKGLEFAKCAMALCLFSGGTENSRSNSHILFIGDPGLGKSTLLKEVASIPAVAYYVCGSGNTSVGLTASMTDCGNDCFLDPGALVLSHGGVCCIDEFDKMTSKHGALLECMEQQSVTVAKNGLVCSLPAECAVIAAGNPVGGHYDQSKGVKENVNIHPAILSRFDLILGLLDEAIPGRERKLATYIMKQAEGNWTENEKEEHPTVKYFFNEGYQTQRPRKRVTPCDDVNEITCVPTLRARLQENCWNKIPKEVIRDYLAYAKNKFPSVKLSHNAKMAIKRYFLDVKHFGGRIPVTTRQLSGIIRLTKARARMELREIATLDDACDAIELFDLSWFGLNYDVGTPSVHEEDERVEKPCDKSCASSARPNNSRKSQTQNFLAAAQQEGNSVSKHRLKEIFEENISWNVIFDDFLESLNLQGFIISQGSGMYKVML